MYQTVTLPSELHTHYKKITSHCSKFLSSGQPSIPATCADDVLHFNIIKEVTMFIELPDGFEPPSPDLQSDA